MSLSDKRSMEMFDLWIYEEKDVKEAVKELMELDLDNYTGEWVRDKIKEIFGSSLI